MNTTKKYISFSPPDITDAEMAEVINTMRSGWITTGPKTKRFEQRIANFIGVPKAVCLSSMTAAMELTLRLLGIGEGDEVITTVYTYTATAAVIHHVGAKIILVDTAPDSFEMDYEKMQNVITPRTKAIIGVDIGGKMCDYNKLLSITRDKRVLFKPKGSLQEQIGRVSVIADSAHGFGATRNGVVSGKAADFTCFSFHAVKNLTTAEGGAVVWSNIEGIDNEWLYDMYMRSSLHGQTKDALTKMQRGAWEYDIVYPAYKCNMTDILASLGLVQIERYDDFIRRRHEIIKIYDRKLVPLGIESLQHFGHDYMSSGHLYMVRIPGITENERNEIIADMIRRGVACNVHFKPLPMFSAYRELGFSMGDFPNAYRMYENEISLPLHTQLSDGDVNYVAESFMKVVKDFIRSDSHKRTVQKHV